MKCKFGYIIGSNRVCSERRILYVPYYTYAFQKPTVTTLQLIAAKCPPKLKIIKTYYTFFLIILLLFIILSTFNVFRADSVEFYYDHIGRLQLTHLIGSGMVGIAAQLWRVSWWSDAHAMCTCVGVWLITKGRCE